MACWLVEGAVYWTPVPNLAEDRPRAYQQSGRTAIVCHCEMVTEAEIDAAFVDPLPVATLGGLRRRTRCMMGRCQGFYCTRRISELAAGRIPNCRRLRSMGGTMPDAIRHHHRRGASRTDGGADVP